MTQNKVRCLRPVGGEYAGPLSVQWLAAMPLGCLLSARRTAFRSISSLNFDLLPILSNDLGDRLLALDHRRVRPGDAAAAGGGCTCSRRARDVIDCRPRRRARRRPLGQLGQACMLTTGRQ